MIDAYCPSCDAVALYSLSRVTLVNTPLGIEIRVRCYCEQVLEIVSGAGPRVPAAAGGYRG